MPGSNRALVDSKRFHDQNRAVISPALERSLPLLRCPVTREPLTLLEPEELAVMNRALAAGEWRHRDGSNVAEPLSLALGTADRRLVYRIEDEIIWLLADMAILPAAEVAGSDLPPEKRVVRAFYDDFGWAKSEDGVFNDTKAFTEVGSQARGYRRKCNTRIGRWLSGGAVLLDVASGAIPHPEYLDYSNGYETRICMDFCVRALREARQKLGDKGLYVIGDITRLPLANGAVDAVISLHTIYHVPQPEQTAAVDELVRVTRPGGRVVIAYLWGYSWAMNTVFRVRGWLGWLRRMGRPSPVAAEAAAARDTGMPDLYFHPQNYDWFAREVAPRHDARLRVWSAVSTAFQNRFFVPGFAGRLILRLVLAFESLLPWLAGRVGQYPLFVINVKAGRAFCDEKDKSR